MHGGGHGQVRNPPSSIVARVFGAAAEAEVHQGTGPALEHGERGGRVATLSALRRTGSLPQVREAPQEPFQSREGNRGLEIPREPRPLARTRRSPPHGRTRKGN